MVGLQRNARKMFWRRGRRIKSLEPSDIDLCPSTSPESVNPLILTGLILWSVAIQDVDRVFL